MYDNQTNYRIHVVMPQFYIGKSVFCYNFLKVNVKADYLLLKRNIDMHSVKLLLRSLFTFYTVSISTDTNLMS